MCPDLGKATYFLVLDSQQFDAGLAEADATATKITTSIGQKLGMVGTEAQAAGAEVGAAGTEMAGGFEKAGGAAAAAGTEAKAGAAEMVTAARGAAAGTETAAAGSTLAWGKMGTSIGAMGTKSFGIWKLAGLAAIFEVAKGGIHWLSDTNKYTLQLNNAIRATHDVASVSTKDMLKFSDSAEALATEGGRSAVLQLQTMLLGFTNIRNEGPKAAAIFDRVRQAALDISARTGRSLTTVAVALGKAFQDPVKYMNTLGRAGVTFNKQQQQTVAALIAANKPLQAQQYMLQLLSRYSGSAAKQAQSFAGQWRIARGELEHSSAQIVTAFIPAFKQIVGVLVAVAGFLSHHTALVRNVTIAYLAWKGAALGIGIAMGLWRFGAAIAGFLGIGRAATVSEQETRVATLEMRGGIAGLQEQIAILNKQLMGIGTAAVAGTGEADAALGGLDASLVGTSAVVAETDVAIASIGPTAVATAVVADGAFAAIGAAALAALGPIAALVAAIYILGKFSGTDGPKNLHIVGKTASGTENIGLDNRGHRYIMTPRGPVPVGRLRGLSGPSVVPPNFGTGTAHPGGGGGRRSQYRQQHPATHPLSPQNFSLQSELSGPAWTKLQIAYDQAQLTKSSADDKRALTQEYDFLNHILKTRKLSLPEKQTVLAQMVSVHNQLQSLNIQIGKAASSSLDKLLGKPWMRLDIAEQKAKQSGSLQKDKKALQNEEDFLKKMLQNRKLSLENRRKIEHQLTAVEDKIKAINRKMASSAKSSQVSEMEAFNELQGTFFGQFAPNIFGSSPKGLTLGSQRVKQPHHRVQHHAMGGVIHYARGGAVDMNYVREAPHYASHEARFHRAGLAYFSANSPTKERRGTDTVPAMLTPGELVLNRDQQRMLRARLGMPRSGSANELFSAIQHGGNEHDSALVLRLAHHQLSMERGGSRAPYRKDISTWLRQFQGMSKAQTSAAQDWWGTNYGEIRRGYATGGAVSRGVHHTHTHTHVHKMSGPPIKSYVPPRGSLSYIEHEARRMGLDVNAVMGVASGEGLGGGIGDHGTSFGPWQLHRGGAYPRWAPQGEMAAQRWAWSHAGINYALQRMRAVAHGLHGHRAAQAIINRFERPANPMSDYNAYLTYVGSHGMGGPTMRQGHYSSPFARHSVFERVDQGVDYLVKGAVHAVGAGRIASVTGGMAGGTGTIIKERLNRPIKINGRTYYGVYYSEGSAMAKAGQRVRAGQAVMGGGGVEIGFLNSKMQMPPLRGGLGAGTKADAAGWDFLNLVSDLRTGRRVGMPPIFGPRRTVRHGNRWLMVPDGGSPMNPGFPDIGGISGLVPQTTPATTATDSVPAMLTPGEMVLNQSQQELLRQKLGLQALNSPQQLFSSLMNPQHYAKGGIVLRRSGQHIQTHHHHHPGLFGGLAKAITGGAHAATSTTHYVGHQTPAAIHHATDHPSPHHYYIPAGRGMMPVSHAEYRAWHKKNVTRPDAGFSLSGVLGHQFSPIAHLASGAASFGYNVAKSTAMLANQAINPNNAGLDFLKASLALALTRNPRPMLHWLTEGYGGKQGAGRQWKDFLTNPVKSYHKAASGQYGRSSAMDAMYVNALTKGQYEFAKGAVTHPLRNPRNTALLLAMMATPWMRRLGPALPDVDYGTNLRGAVLNKVLGVGLRVHGLGIHGGPRSPRDQLGHEAQAYLGVRDFYRSQGHDPYSADQIGTEAQAYLRTRRGLQSAVGRIQEYTGPHRSNVTGFHSAAAHELEAHAALARDVGRTMHPMEWPNWVRNQLRNQGLLDKYTRRWGQSGGGLGIVGTRRESKAIWNQTLKARDKALLQNPRAATMWQLPDAHLWRGGDPVSAIGHLNNYVTRYSQFAPWYDAMGLTMQYGSELERSMFGRDISSAQLAAVKSLTSPRNRVPANLRLAIDAARHTHDGTLSPEMLRVMSQGMGYAHAVPSINRLLRGGAHGLGHNRLGLPGDILAGGPKAPSYFHNIMHSIFPDQYPAGPVTIDTIAGDALIPGMAKLEKEKLFKRDRHYGLFAEIYRKIGAKRDMLGKEAQASVWVPHRAFMSSVARGGTGNLGRLTGAVDWLHVFGEKYSTAAQRRLAERISGTGYGGLGVVSSHDRAASLTPISESYNAGITQIMESMGGGGALNAGVYRVLFNDQTQGVIKFFKRRDRLVNELLATQVGRAVGAYMPDMAEIDEHAVAMRVAEGKSAQTHGWNAMHALELSQSRAGQRLGLLDNLIGNTDRHLGNVIAGEKGPIAIDNELSFGYGWGPSGRSSFGMGGGTFAPEFNPRDLTPADITHLDEELQKLRPNFSRLGREHSWRGVVANWKILKDEAFNATGDPLTKLTPAEYEPFLGGSVSPTESISPNVLEQLRSLIQEGGYSSAGRGDSYRSGGSDRPGPDYTWDPQFGEWTRRPVHHSSGWTWRNGQGFEPVSGTYVRRSQITPPFTAGNRQILGLGQNTRDIFHALIDRFSPGEPNRRLAERAYRLLKIYPDKNVISAGYHAAMPELRSIHGADVPHDLFTDRARAGSAPVVPDLFNKARIHPLVRQRGLSGLIERLHERYHYPLEMKNPSFERRGDVGTDRMFSNLINALPHGWQAEARIARDAAKGSNWASVERLLSKIVNDDGPEVLAGGGANPAFRALWNHLFPANASKRRFSTGGSVTGSGTGDTVSAMLTPGEIVLNSAQQILLRRKLGLTSLGSPQQLFNEIAARHYAAGGIVEGLDLAQQGQPALYTTATPSLGYAQKRDIARLVGIESRARELYASTDRGHTLHYEQTNHYSELPKDPFEEARQMKQAVHASFLT